MAAGCRGLSRIVGASAGPAGSRVPSRAGGNVKAEYDAVVIGAGHNGLVAAAYLQRLGVNTAVFERRHVIGGAAVTEEIIPGFKFSRASYLLSLLRPQIYSDLELKKHGLRLHLRDPHSFTPVMEEGAGSKVPRSLLLGRDTAENQKQIAQFSQKDAQVFPRYEEFMSRLVLAIDPLLDAAPVDMEAFQHHSLLQRLKALSTLKPLLKAGRILGAQLPQYYQVLTAPITKVLDQWFESEPLKATLATDAVIGAMTSPYTPGSGYVLLHHVMGCLEGQQGAWGYVQGGMGALSDAIASSAAVHGTSIFTEKTVAKVQVNREGRVQGVVLQDGQEVKSRVVLSSASPQVTFLTLTPQSLTASRPTPLASRALWWAETSSHRQTWRESSGFLEGTYSTVQCPWTSSISPAPCHCTLGTAPLSGACICVAAGPILEEESWELLEEMQPTWSIRTLRACDTDSTPAQEEELTTANNWLSCPGSSAPKATALGSQVYKIQLVF
ncbi:pyridine nucleotide-disulfide oxidoreductase domain-containing protein 2 isoform X2 [Octodon degus]|uniref:Pyridine nucleotide-disulfide oxidoreductase domain-containing protein 2 isoform X2 n=1 Tax=Octodon degus TaxID=10160 RepID=A0A6P6DX67_OCTDE|nr:pyridine nucleotide-disulfide oxidoreductase domain-containing protein 2 isoform X2 [Octodon degus]